jgi:hypothetical protein
MTMAAGENSSPMNPSGPCREMKPNTSNPTTTVGSDNRVLNSVMTARLPGNATVPMQKPKGTAVSVARNVARVDTHRERHVMENTSRSKENIRENAVENPSRIKSMIHRVLKETVLYFDFDK